VSREFGDNGSGFMHERVRSAAEDCLEPTVGGQVTPLLGQILLELYPIAYAVAGQEAFDVGPETPVFEAIEALPHLKAAVAALEEHVRPYRDVARRAVEAAVREASS